MPAELLSRRLLLVTGKGGVGKSTVAAALGLAAAAAGRRTVIAETSGSTRMAQLFGVASRGYEPTPLADRLYAVSITPEAAMEDYVVSQIKVKTLYEMVFKNRVMAPFVDGIPGLHDAIQMGKVFDLDREKSPSGRKAWDLVIVDAPATGHGLTMLGAPRSMMELTRSGPLHDAVKLLHDVFDDPSVTGLLLVTLPEDMPVSETLELHQRLGGTRRQVLGCVLNEWWPAAELPLEEARRLDLSALPAAEAARQALLQQAARQERQEQQRARLAAGLGATVTPLPFLFRRNLGAADLATLGLLLLAGGGA